MRLDQQLAVSASRQVRAAAAVAALLGGLSLVVGLRTWDERRYLDLETLLGIVDAAVVLGLAVALARGSRIAALLLLGLALVGLGLILWRGLPLTALAVQLIAVGFYARAHAALNYLRGSQS